VSRAFGEIASPRSGGLLREPTLRGVVATLLTVLALIVSGHLPAYASGLPPKVAAALKGAGIPESHAAVFVQEVGAKHARLAVNADRPMNPASVMKLVTTYAALELLGPAYTWTTEAYSVGNVTDGVLAGDLYLKGSGDPKLTLEQFWLLLRDLRARGVREIRGDLVLDRGLFEPREPERFDDNPLRAYNVTPDALLLNFKALRLTFLPDAERRTVALVVEPQPAQLDLVNLLKLSNGACNDWREHVRADFAMHGPNARLVLTGSFPAACGEKNWNLGLLSHPNYVFGVFKQLWQELGGKLDGNLKEGQVPASARSIASIESPALSEIVRDINKWSNNVMARQVFLTLGASGGARPAREADGEAAIRTWLAAKGLNFPELVLENGSGLSRKERISAENLGRLMQAAFRGPVMPEFVASLALTAVDGTMKKRLKDNGVAGQAHIKTGTLEGVKTIAGYVLDQTGRRWIVVFFVNHPDASAAQAAQDALLAWVHQG